MLGEPGRLAAMADAMRAAATLDAAERAATVVEEAARG
jgi:UDP-N-acetylglucosamine:LPS N-acetylglucosamine transferase